MSDISLDLDEASPNFNSFKIVDNDLVMTTDADPNGTNNILQNILQNLRFFLGEWFLDNTQGTPWFQEILIKGPNQGNVDAILVNKILETPGVETLLTYDFVINSAKRTLKVTFSAMTTTGKVNYSGDITAGGTT